MRRIGSRGAGLHQLPTPLPSPYPHSLPCCMELLPFSEWHPSSTGPSANVHFTLAVTGVPYGRFVTPSINAGTSNITSHWKKYPGIASVSVVSPAYYLQTTKEEDRLFIFKVSFVQEYDLPSHPHCRSDFNFWISFKCYSSEEGRAGSLRKGGTGHSSHPQSTQYALGPFPPPPPCKQWWNAWWSCGIFQGQFCLSAQFHYSSYK